MEVEVTTYLESDEEVHAVFNVETQLKGRHDECITAEFVEAWIPSPIEGMKPRKLKKHELEGYGIFDELENEACENYDPVQADDDAREYLAELRYDCEKESE